MYIHTHTSTPSASSGFGFKLLGQVRNEWVTGMTPNEWHWVSVSAAVAQGAELKGESGLVFDSAWPEPIQFGALKLEIFDQLPLSRLRPVTLEEGVRQWKDSSAVLVNVPRHLLGAKLYQFPTRMYGAFSIQLAAGADGRCPPRQLHVAFHPGRDGGLEAFFRSSTGWIVTNASSSVMAWMSSGGAGAATGPMWYASMPLPECPPQQAPAIFAFPPATQERLMSVFISANASTASPQGTVTDDLVTVLIEDECSKALDAELAERYIF